MSYKESFRDNSMIGLMAEPEVTMKTFLRISNEIIEKNKSKVLMGK